MSTVLESRIRSNEWRLIGVGSSVLATVLAIMVGATAPDLSLVGGIAFVGLPVAIICGWIFAPVVVVAPRRWLLPVVVGIGTTAAVLGWLGASAMLILGTLLFGLLPAGILISAAGLPVVVPALFVAIPVVAVWAIIVRGCAAWRQRPDRASP